MQDTMNFLLVASVSLFVAWMYNSQFIQKAILIIVMPTVADRAHQRARVAIFNLLREGHNF